MDVDGHQKSKVTSYGQSDSEMEGENSDKPEPESDADESKIDPKLLKDIKANKDIFKMKHSKYL